MTLEAASLSGRAARALEKTDEMPADLRGCVHEFGYAIVNACLIAGRQPGQRGVGNGLTRVASVVDWMLANSGSSLSAKGFTRELLMNSMVIIPREPTSTGVEASIQAIRGMGLLTKTEKHTIRLRDAILASTKASWPHLFEGKE
jgi:hypothetical protein